VLGIVAIVKVPPFDTIGAPLQAKLCTLIVVAYILGTAISGGLERFASVGKAPPLKKISSATTTTSITP
jgi:hypothetical protein